VYHTEKIIDPSGSISSLPDVEFQRDYYWVGANMGAGGLAIPWLCAIMDNNPKSELPEYPDATLKKTLKMAGECAPGADGLFFFPHLIGERAPYYNVRYRI